jgi:DNA/RNA-binding domain of Phe-tRNA-synthetase-like protein
MTVRLIVDPALRSRFPGLAALLFAIEGVHVEKSDAELERFKAESVQRFRSSYSLETLKDVPALRAYRDFFWRVGIDPTKIRPASEALLRRVLQGKDLPRINTLVDSYNIASMETHVPLAVFDAARVKGDMVMRMAVAGEKFKGIGMTEEDTLSGSEVVVQDDRALIAVYPYRDADSSKVATETKDVLIMVCGVPGIELARLNEARKLSAQYVTRFCGGRTVAGPSLSDS